MPACVFPCMHVQTLCARPGLLAGTPAPRLTAGCCGQRAQGMQDGGGAEQRVSAQQIPRGPRHAPAGCALVQGGDCTALLGRAARKRRFVGAGSGCRGTSTGACGCGSLSACTTAPVRVRQDFASQRRFTRRTVGRARACSRARQREPLVGAGPGLSIDGAKTKPMHMRGFHLRCAPRCCTRNSQRGDDRWLMPFCAAPLPSPALRRCRGTAPPALAERKAHQPPAMMKTAVIALDERAGGRGGAVLRLVQHGARRGTANGVSLLRMLRMPRSGERAMIAASGMVLVCGRLMRRVSPRHGP